MPILLDTPLPATLDSHGATEYGEYKIIDPQLGNASKRIPFRGEYGNTVDGAWRAAHPYGRKMRHEDFVIVDHPADPDADPPVEANPEYTTMIANAKATAIDELAYTITKNAMYAWLQSKRPDLSGTVI